MKIHRPRLTENEYNYLQTKQLFDKKLFRVAFICDPHGWLVDQKVLSCIHKVLQANPFDEIMFPGDLIDLPYVSRHEKKLYNDGILKDYSEIGEIEYTKEAILETTRKSISDKTKIRYIPGNHCERITKPGINSKGQLARLHVLHKEYKTTELEIMLDFEKYGVEWDKKDTWDYFDKITVVHGLSLARNAPEKNIQEYMSSGVSGHSHRLRQHYITNKKNPYVWVEGGCTRIRTEVEYFPTGRIPDWQNGFATIDFYKANGDVYFFAEVHPIIDGMCKYNGIIYNGNDR